MKRITDNLHVDLGTFLTASRRILLERGMFQTKHVQKTKTRILCSLTFFWKSCPLWDSVEKYGRAGQVTGDNVVGRMGFARWIMKATDTHS